MRFRQLSLATFTLLVALALPSRAEYPDRPIQLIVPFPAGGGVDVVGRKFAEVMTELLKQPVAVINRDGASGVIAMEFVANAAPDGYTLAFSPNGPITIQPYLKKLPYDPAALKPICQVVEAFYVLAVPPGSNLANLKDLVARAKTPPGVKYAIGGIATLPHFVMLQLAKTTGGDYLGVPYRGDPRVVVALRANEVDVGVLTGETIAAQGFRTLAVFSEQRLPVLPDVPTAREQGFDVVGKTIVAVYAPKGVPEAIAQRLEATCSAVTRSEKFQSAMKLLKQEPAFLPGPKLAEALAADGAQKRQLIDATGMKQEQ
jgi:tripartite-type tricarboxylate transporter receptor subunit TctC